MKIVAQLLPNLPSELNGKPEHYRIVFMERNLDEVVASQRTMLDHQGSKGAGLDTAAMADMIDPMRHREKAPTN